MTVGEFGEGAGQPVVRVDAAELAVLDQRRDHRPVIAALGQGLVDLVLITIE